MNNMNIEEKPYLQDIFDHMQNEHGLILLQSEMQEIVSICNTDLSAENEQLKFESQNYADLFRASQEVVNQYKEALRELVKMCDTFGIDNHYLYPEVQNAIKLLNTESNDSE